MKKLWIMMLCAVMLMATACGSGQQAAPEKEVEKDEPDEKEIEYEEFERLGMTFKLPEGTEEEESEPGEIYYYRNGDLYIMLEYDDEYQLNDKSISTFVDNVASGFEDARTGDIEKCKVDGHAGYQVDISGVLSGIDMIATLTVFNMVKGNMCFVVSNQSTDKSDYEDINKVLIDSIDIDDAAWAKAMAPDYYVDGYTAVTESSTIKITDYKILKPGEGANAYGKDYVIYFEYDMTNNSGEKMSPAVEWPCIMKVVQDNSADTVNTLNPAVLIGDKYAEVAMQDIKAGGTVHCSHSYTLDDTTTPVTLTVTNGIAGEELGTMTFKVK